jgi:hypothetical protein
MKRCAYLGTLNDLEIMSECPFIYRKSRNLHLLESVYKSYQTLLSVSIYYCVKDMIIPLLFILALMTTHFRDLRQ